MNRFAASLVVLTAGFGWDSVVSAQTATSSVDEYLCKFADKCGGDSAAPAVETREVEGTRGFSIARPGSSRPVAPPVRGAARVTPARPDTIHRSLPSRDNAGRRADLRLSFEKGSAKLTPQGMVEARVFAEFLKRPEASGKRFRIEGHTDSSGGRGYNMRLSQVRAQAVADFLIGLGVAPDQLTVQGLGYDRPLPGRPITSPENRRVEAVRI